MKSLFYFHGGDLALWQLLLVFLVIGLVVGAAAVTAIYLIFRLTNCIFKFSRNRGTREEKVTDLKR